MSRTSDSSLKCPACGVQLAIDDDATFDDVTCQACGAKHDLLADASHDDPPLLAGRYRLLELAGVGGFGALYRAVDEQLDRVVAVKLSHRFAAPNDAAAHFLREARAAAQLRHPHIVTVYEAGRDGEATFIVSAFVHGETLAARIKRDKLAPRAAAALTAAVADAVHYAHTRGVVHRDLKPTNIILDKQGAPHVTDFGLARRLSSDESVTVSGQVLGTLAYMSPEQALGEAHRAGPRSDVYSLGAVLYELLTGEPPFTGTSPAVLRKLVELEPPRIRSSVAAAPRELESICLKCLEKDPERRYATALEFAEDLRRYLEHQPIRARPIGPLRRAGRWARRNPVVTSLAACTAALALAGFTAGVVQWRSAIAAAEQLRRVSYRSAIPAAELALSDGDLAAAQRLLLRQIPDSAKGQEDLRGFEWGRLAHEAFAASRHQALVHDRPTMKMAFSPDGRQLVVGSRETIIYDLAGDARVQGRLPIASWRGVEYCDEGRRLVLRDPDGIHVLDRDSLQIESSIPLDSPRDWNNLLAVSPAGACTIAFRNLEGELEFYDVAQGVSRSLASPPSLLSAYCATYDAGGYVLVTGHERGVLRRWDATTGEERSPPLHGHVGPVLALATSPDGSLIASGDLRSIVLWDAETWDQRGKLTNNAMGVWALAFSPDGGLLASGGTDNTVHVWDVQEQAHLTRLLGHTDDVRCLRFSPRGDLLASAGQDGRVVLWDVARLPLHDVARERFSETAVLADTIAIEGDFLVGRGPNNAFVRWDSGNGRTDVFGDPGYRVSTVPWDGSKFTSILVSDEQPSVVRVCRADTGDVAGEVRYESPEPRLGASFSRDGDLLCVIRNGRGLDVWDWRHGKMLREIEVPEWQNRTPASSPNGRLLAIKAGMSVRIVDLRDGEVLCESSFPGQPYAFVFSPDGRTLAVGDTEGHITLWDVAEDRQEVLTDAAGIVLALAYAPDGKQLAASGWDLAVTLWDLQAREPIGTLRGHQSAVSRLRFSDDGHTLASVDIDGTARLWRAMPPGELKLQ